MLNYLLNKLKTHSFIVTIVHCYKSLTNDFKTLSPKIQKIVHLMFGIVFLILIIGVGVRIYMSEVLVNNTNDLATLKVTVTNPIHGPDNEEIMIPGTVQAWHEATIYARSPGYVDVWYTDIGAHVKQNDLLAILEAPEVNAELMQAEADLKVAEANNVIAQITDKRWKLLLETDSVSQQAADEKASAAAAALAMVNTARANVDRLRNLVDFQSIVAPFDGIITARYVDVGSLINNGASKFDPRVFYIVQSDRLRVYVRVPQYYAPRLTKNMTVNLRFTEHPGKVYPAKLISTAEAIDRKSRTLLAEFMIDNANYELLPGSYVEVHFTLPIPNYITRIPINAILFRAQNLQVATVDSEGIVTLKEIIVERDFGDSLEITHGTTTEDVIVLNPTDSIRNGQKVEIIKHINEKGKV